MKANRFMKIACGMSGCPKWAVDQCYYCGLPLCEEHASKVAGDAEERYCRECFLFLSVSGRIDQPLARKVVPKVLIVDSSKCTGCRSCELACSFRFGGAYSNSDGAIRIRKFEPECINIPVLCKQCAQPKCMDVCPSNALRKDSETGVVLLDTEDCTGCMECVEACPYNAIFKRPGEDVVAKCDLCLGNPKCVEVCETNAVEWVNKYDAGERRNPILFRNRRTIPGSKRRKS